MTAKTDDQRPDHERPDDRTSEIRGQNPGQAAEDGRADEAAVAGDVNSSGSFHGLLRVGIKGLGKTGLGIKGDGLENMGL